MRLQLGEILIIAFVLLIVFSAARMGQLGNAIGKFVYSFRKASKGQGFVEGKTLRRMGSEDAEYQDRKKSS